MEISMKNQLFELQRRTNSTVIGDTRKKKERRTDACSRARARTAGENPSTTIDANERLVCDR